MNRLTMMLNTADAQAIERHLRACDNSFFSPLSDRVDLGEYAEKIARLADRFELWEQDRLVGLVAVYLNDTTSRRGYISSVSLCRDYTGKGLGSELIQRCSHVARDKGFASLLLEVAEGDTHTRRLYNKLGFELVGNSQNGFLKMQLNLPES
jgi:ribosomal protein S18 acetylase RimI-like enzyme